MTALPVAVVRGGGNIFSPTSLVCATPHLRLASFHCWEPTKARLSKISDTTLS